MPLKFDAPPINELVIAIYYDQGIKSLGAEHVGLFWSQIRDRFPTIRQHPPVMPPHIGYTTQDPYLVEFDPMPRLWLESTDQETVIQIQKNAFMLNWRSRGGRYPSYEKVKEDFDTYKKLFFKFLKEVLNEEEPKTRLADLTYTNLVKRSDYWTGLQDTSKIIPNFSIAVPVSTSEVPDFQQAYIQKINDELALNTSIKSARSAQDPTAPMLVIEYRALGLLSDPSTLDKWFSNAHIVIDDCFSKMTAKDIQINYWKSVQ